ncbi:MAG: cell wall-binding repeat-containing protein, partial [Lachnospiraceae bacterium]|nr:cell wall-binding repeat-containing protein [Lachnospiraceae bacterium]
DPVTECWEDGTRTDKTVRFRVVPRPIVLTSGSALKAWDGTALREDSYQLSPGKLPEGSFVNVPEGLETMPDALSEGDEIGSVSVTGFRIDAGMSENLIEDARILRGTEDVTRNYDISYVYGELTVEPVPIDLPEDAVYKWNGSEREISFRAIHDALSEAAMAGITVLDANENDITASVPDVTYFDGSESFRLFGTGAWNQHWSYRMSLKPDRNHYWSEALHGQVNDERTVTLQILPELGNAKDLIIAASGRSMVDGFSASGLAGLLNAPIVSVARGPEELSEEEIQKIARLVSPEGARVWIMGGSAAVSAGIENELRSMIGGPRLNLISVQRITGKERYSTAWHIFESGHGNTKITEHTWNPSGTVIILPGDNVEPALSIMTYAYAAKIPVLLAKEGILPDYYKDLDGDGVSETLVSATSMLQTASFSQAILIGPEEGTGRTYISAECEEQLKSANPSVRIMRINGTTIGTMSNAIISWMESSSSGTVQNPDVYRSGRYSYVAPDAVPPMKDSGRVVLISDYESIFHEIDVLGNAHLYVRTSAQMPYRYTLTLTNGGTDDGPVLQGWFPDDSITEVYFGGGEPSPLGSYRPEAPEGYVLCGFGAPVTYTQYSYADGILRMTLKDSYLSAFNGTTRQALLYAIYVEEGKDPSDRRNYRRYKENTGGGTAGLALSDASDCRIIVALE